MGELVARMTNELTVVESASRSALTSYASIEAAKAMREQGERLIHEWVHRRAMGMTESESADLEKRLGEITSRWRDKQEKADEVELGEIRLNLLQRRYEALSRMLGKVELIVQGAKFMPLQ